MDVIGSPAFSIQQKFDSNDNDDWNLASISDIDSEIKTYEIAKNVAECQVHNIGSTMKYPLQGIHSVSYISDGDKLNTTLWLSEPIEDPSIKKILVIFEHLN